MEAEPVATNVSPSGVRGLRRAPEPKPSAELQTEVERQVHDWLAGCLKV